MAVTATGGVNATAREAADPSQNRVPAWPSGHPAAYCLGVCSAAFWSSLETGRLTRTHSTAAAVPSCNKDCGNKQIIFIT